MFEYTFQSCDFLVDSTFIFNNPYCLDLDYNIYFFSFFYISKTFKIFSGLTSMSLFLYSISPNILFDAVNLYYNNHIFMAFDFKYTSLNYFYLLLWKIDYIIYFDYIIYYIYIICLLIYFFCFSIIFKYLIKFYSYFYNFFLYMLNTFKFNTFLKDALNVNFFKSLSLLYSYYYTSWILYLEWEYKLIFDREIKHKLNIPILHFAITYLCSAKYVHVWTDSMDLWRFLLRLFFKLFYLPFYTFYVFIVRLLMFYLDYFGLLKFIFVCISLFYWRFLQNMNVLKANIISTFAFKTLNRLAYLMFFDYHYSLMYFVYSFLPKKFHIHDPATFGASYPAIMHPWVKSLLITIRGNYSYSGQFYNNIYYMLNILTYISQYINILFLSTIQYTFSLLFYVLKFNYGFTYILIFQKLRNFLLYFIVLFPRKVNIYFFLLFCIYIFFCSSLFCLVFLFCIYFFICILKDKLLYIYNALSFGFIFLGYIVFLPFYFILFIARLFVFTFVFIMTSFFNIFFVFFIFFIFLKYDTIFIFEFLWYLLKPIAFDWFFDYLNFYVFGALLEFHFNWKTFLISNVDLTTYYLKIASNKYHFRLKYNHYYDLLFNSLGFFKLHSIRLWFNNPDYFYRRLNTFYYVRFSFWFYSSYLFLIKGPQSIAFYFTNGNLFLFYFYCNTFINYIIYNLYLHLGLLNYLFVRYFLVLSYIEYLPRYYYIYICPIIFWFKSFYYLNILVIFVSDRLIMFCLYLFSFKSFTSYIYNFDIYSFIYSKYLLFHILFFNIYYFIFDIFFFFNYICLDNLFVALKFIRRVYLFVIFSSDYLFDYIYSYLRFSRIRLDDFINFREFYMTKANWKLK